MEDGETTMERPLRLLACALVALSACKFERQAPAGAHMSDAERNAEQCVLAGGNEESCVYQEMARTMLPKRS
jgi:hypothetical protein